MLSITFTPGDLTPDDRKALLMFLNAGASTAIATLPTANVVAPPATDTSDDGAPAPYTPGERDAGGLPWDERIHSSNHAKTAGGTWRKRRGVSDADVAAIEAMLRVVNPAPVAPPAPPAAPGVPPELPPFLDVRGQTTPAVAPPPPAPIVTPSTPTGVSFIDVMKKITALQQEGKDPNPVLQQVGVTNFAQMAPNDPVAQSLRDMAIAMLNQL